MFRHRALETKHGEKGIPLGRQPWRGGGAQSWPEAYFGFLGQGEKGDDTGVDRGSSV